MNRGLGYGVVFGMIIGALGMFVVMSSLIRSQNSKAKAEESAKVIVAEETKKEPEVSAGWEEMKKTIMECKVKSSVETADGVLTLELRDGGIMKTDSYLREELYPVLVEAGEVCGEQIPVAIE